MVAGLRIGAAGLGVGRHGPVGRGGRRPPERVHDRHRGPRMGGDDTAVIRLSDGDGFGFQRSIRIEFTQGFGLDARRRIHLDAIHPDDMTARILVGRRLPAIDDIEHRFAAAIVRVSDVQRPGLLRAVDIESARVSRLGSGERVVD